MAGSSYVVTGKVRHSHIQQLKDIGASVEVHFDGSHSLAVKPAHFEVNLTLRDRLSLEHLDSSVAQLFGLYTQEVNLTNRVKYEVANFDEDLIDRSKKSYEIRAALDALNNGGIPGMISSIF
jgi:hypothetical protein